MNNLDFHGSRQFPWLIAFRWGARGERTENFQHVVARPSRAHRQSTTTHRKRNKNGKNSYRKLRFTIGTDIPPTARTRLLPFHWILIPFAFCFSASMKSEPFISMRNHALARLNYRAKANRKNQIRNYFIRGGFQLTMEVSDGGGGRKGNQMN